MKRSLSIAISIGIGIAVATALVYFGLQSEHAFENTIDTLQSP